MTETISGILTDYAVMTEGEHAGRYGARINDTPYPVMPHVDAFLTRLQKNTVVDANLNKDGWISKIQAKKMSPIKHAEAERTKEEIAAEQEAYNAKKQAAGFGQPTEAPQDKVKDCTSPETPVVKPASDNGLKTVIGQIVTVVPEKRGIAIKDVEGIIHPLYWLEGNDGVFSRLQKWWFIEVTAEKMGEEWRAISQTKADKPEGWKSSGFGGKGNYQPRNDKAIIYQTAYKEACETARTIAKNTGWSNETEAKKAFEQVMDMALARALKDGAELCKAGGV